MREARFGPGSKGLLLDMGGVVLNMAGGRGMPTGMLDWRGREALVQSIRASQARVTLDMLDRTLFAPWHAGHERRVARLREERWEPHFERLRQTVGTDLTDEEMLDCWFRPYAEQLEPLPGAVEALAELSAEGVPMALVSNVPLPGRHYRRVLEKYRIDQFFEGLFFSYDLDTRKPSPALLRHALEFLGCEASHAVMVGDRRDRDILAGQLAGVATVWIRSEDGGGPAPELSISGLADLPALMRQDDI
ncbi:MAG: HAD family hydrolase [Acidobacteriota bacterium]